MTTMLTREEALEFIVSKLGVTEVEKRLQDDKLGLLNDTIRSYHNYSPFQNLTLLSVPKKERAPPSPEQVKEDVLSRKGGLCMAQNTFVYHLLQELGFDVFLVSSGTSYPENHNIVVTRNLTEEGSFHLVEVGSGYPTFQAIPLDFEEESPVYEHSFLEYKFVRKGELIERQHRRGDLRPGAGGGWRRFYDFSLEPREVEFFQEPMKTVCTVPGTSPFLLSLRVITFSKDKLRAVKDWTLLEEQDDHTLKATEIHSISEMIEIIGEMVPHIEAATVSKALVHWQEATG